MATNVDADPGHVTDASERSTLGDIARAGGFALVFALVVNAAVTTIARMARIGEGLEALMYPSVVALTTVGVVGATLVYAALTRWTNAPDRYFLALAAIVLVVSVVPDFTYIPSEPNGTLLAGTVLATMHVLTAAITILVLVYPETLTQTANE